MPVDEKAVFNAARRIGDEAERARYLEAACQGDAGARARIVALLHAYEAEESFLEAPAVAPPPQPALESPGTVIGPYTLLEQIGEGGFGVVFMAEQTAPVRRRVALKVLKPGMDTRQVIARFEAERQALALMEHPNIAQVLDAGTTATGRPYFVMELVKGIPITEHCDRHRLTPRQRLELFTTVCHAVQHAHQKGIIHRDLKPSNVLVTQHDDRPVAKVIDFGIAKATTGPLTDKTVFTAFAQLIGTPLYMSPEQASLNGIDVDTRSDVYSLGVLLYELLTGATPFAKARLGAAAFDEIRRIIREEEPATPSALVTTVDAAPGVAANRGTDPAKLARLLRGELDWIVMKALEKDRARRYESASGLALDLQRYLADEAVSACPPSAGYRLKKFARRHRGRLAAAAVLGATLLVVAGSIGWTARDGAARRARNADAVAALLAQSEEALRADDTDRAALALEAAERRVRDGGAEALEGRLARRLADLRFLHEVDAIDMSDWGIVLGRTPSYDRALEARWRAALEAYGVTLAEGRAEEAALRVRGSLVRDRALNALDRWLDLGGPATVRAVLEAADPDPYREAVRDALAARDGPALTALAARPEALVQPARFAAVLGRHREVPSDRGRALLESALRDRPGDLGLLTALGLSLFDYDAGNMRMSPSVPGVPDDRRPSAGESLRWFQAAVAAHPTNPMAHANLGVALMYRGDADGAVGCLQKAIRLDASVPTYHSNLGAVLCDGKQDPVAAVPCFEEAIRLDPDVAMYRYNLGNACLASGDRDRAIACYEEAIRLDPREPLHHYNLACALQARGEPDRAIAAYEEAIRLDPARASYHSNLGSVLCDDKREPARAIACFEEAIRLDPTAPLHHFNLGNACRAMGEIDRAVACYEEAIRLAPTYVEAHRSLGTLFLGMGHADRAVACFEEAARLEPTVADAHNHLGVAYLESGDPARAIASCEAAIRLDPDFHEARCTMAYALRARGELDRAIACFEEVIRLAPSAAAAHVGLGSVLCDDKREPARAIACFEEAIRLEPDVAWHHFNLGNACLGVRDRDRAIACYEEAIRLDAGHAGAHFNLGTAFHQKGDPRRAIACFERAMRLDPDLRTAAEQGIALSRSLERGLRNFAKLPQLLRGQAGSPDEQVEAADVYARLEERHLDAVQLYERAFAAEPRLAVRHRHAAARAALLAAAGRGAGAEALGPDERARRRAQALEWLEADLAAKRESLRGDPASAGSVSRELGGWLQDPALGGIRDARQLLDLQDGERRRCTKFWSDVQDLIARAAQK